MSLGRIIEKQASAWIRSVTPNSRLAMSAIVHIPQIVEEGYCPRCKTSITKKISRSGAMRKFWYVAASTPDLSRFSLTKDSTECSWESYDSIEQGSESNEGIEVYKRIHVVERQRSKEVRWFCGHCETGPYYTSLHPGCTTCGHGMCDCCRRV